MRAQRWYRDRAVIAGQARCWPFWTVWPPCLLALALSCVIVCAGLIVAGVNGLPHGQVEWLLADVAGQAIAGLSAAVLLATAASQPRWRRVIALSAWGIVPLQFGWSLLIIHLGGMT